MNFDRWLLALCEKFTHRVQIWSGKDNFWIMVLVLKGSLLLVFVTLCVLIALSSQSGDDLLLALVLGALCSSAVLHMFSTRIASSVKSIQGIVYDRIAQGSRNPMAEWNCSRRRASILFTVGYAVLCVVVYSVGGTWVLLPTLWLPLGGVVADYFLAVTPLHPNESVRA